MLEAEAAKTVQQFLDSGEVERAAELLQTLSPTIRELAEFQKLIAQTSAFQEADALGVTVRPVGFESEKGPFVLSPSNHHGISLDTWYQGRIEEVGEEQVILVFATTTPPKRVFRKSLSLPEWRKLSEFQPLCGMFLEIGEYGDEVRILELSVKDNTVGQG